MDTTPERTCKACGEPLAPAQMKCAACGANQPSSSSPLGMAGDDEVVTISMEEPSPPPPPPPPPAVSEDEPLEIPVEDAPAEPEGDTSAAPDETAPPAEPEAEEPAGDTVQMSLADATKAWVEETPHGVAGASRLEQDDEPEPSSMKRLAVVAVLLALAAAAVAGFLVIGR